ncbi:hypothetical protein CLOSBL3_10661 [Clostridiaceae bacterium BL-3]|nr:hypothetical protein CLOSBL3_10661 [Clostridiaceae bacterium BL-3]
MDYNIKVIFKYQSSEPKYQFWWILGHTGNYHYLIFDICTLYFKIEGGI